MATIRKRDHYYLLEKMYTEIAILLLPTIARTPVTPNQITISNYANAFAILFLLATGHHITAAILVQLYLFLDILDGNLARYKQQFSPLGAKLDNLGDRFFYNAVMIAIGCITGPDWLWTAAFLLAHNLHSYAATTYIVPRIKTCPGFQRFRIKQSLMERGYILGMDLSLQAGLISILLLARATQWILPVTTLLYAADLGFRMLEVFRNREKRIS